MPKFFSIIVFVVFLSISVFSQDIDPQTQSKIDEYKQLVEKYKQEGNTSNTVNYLIKIGNLYWSENDATQALEAFKEAENILANTTNTTAKSQLFNFMAGIYMGTGDYSKAEEYYKKSYDLTSYNLDNVALINLLFNIGSTQTSQAKYNDAINTYNEVLSIAMEINDYDMVINSSAKIANCYDAIGDEQNKNNYLNISMNYERQKNEEILRKQQEETQNQRDLAQKNALRLETQMYRNKMISDSLAHQQVLTEQKQNEIELLNKQKELQDLLIEQQEKELLYEKQVAKARNRVITILIVGIIFIIAAFFWIFRLYLINKKQKEQLNKFNIELQDKNEKINKQAIILEKQKKDMEIQNKKINDSITYASRIQQAILPVKNAIENSFKGAVIFYRPRDVVSGDFYWFTKMGNEKIIAAVDCTGHSVPGAFMSMIANTLLNEIIKTKGITDLAKVLHELNKGVIENLHSSKNVEGLNDGMDISLYKFEEGKRTAKFASANHVSVIFVDENQTVVEGDYFSIGGMEDQIEVTFHEKEVNLGEKATIYMFSDGFIDQFNKKGKKYMSKRFIEFLQDIYTLNFNEQEERLLIEFEKWREDFRQIDDILVIGLSV